MVGELFSLFTSLQPLLQFSQQICVELSAFIFLQGLFLLPSTSQFIFFVVAELASSNFAFSHAFSPLQTKSMVFETFLNSVSLQAFLPLQMMRQEVPHPVGQSSISSSSHFSFPLQVTVHDFPSEEHETELGLGEVTATITHRTKQNIIAEHFMSAVKKILRSLATTRCLLYGCTSFDCHFLELQELIATTT